jgi:hypothetical protein
MGGGMRRSGSIVLVATVVASCLTLLGFLVTFVWPLVSTGILLNLLNPSAGLVDWIWPGGMHSGRPLGIFSAYFLIGFNFIIWWVLAFLLVFFSRRLASAR